MEMQQTHCYATELLRFYGNATGCIGYATKETQHVTISLLFCLIIYSVSLPNFRILNCLFAIHNTLLSFLPCSFVKFLASISQLNHKQNEDENLQNGVGTHYIAKLK
jgi:hypothetical protein